MKSYNIYFLRQMERKLNFFLNNEIASNSVFLSKVLVTFLRNTFENQ